MRMMHLQHWIAEARRTDIPDATNWLKLVDLVQKEYQDILLSEEAMWKVVAMIPKGGRHFGWTGIIEVLWKTIAAILNRSLGAAIILQEDLHGIRYNRGTGNASLEAKPLQKMMATREEVLYEILLDLYKAYSAL